VLVPEVASGAAPELADLRAACLDAIRTVAAVADRLVLLGAATRTFTHSFAARGSFSGYGVDLQTGLVPDAEGPLELPLSVTVGAWLVREALGPGSSTRAFSVAADAASVVNEVSRLANHERVGLVVMGDGSARRSTAAPGYLDARAVAFDDSVVTALRAGDPDALGAIDLGLADDLLCAGAAAWHAAGLMMRGASVDSVVHYYDAPYGVAYVVATWTAND